MTILKQLEMVLRQRKGAAADGSYVASLYDMGLDKILEKVGEEAVETVIAAKNCKPDDPALRQALVGEVADLWFHAMVMLAYLDMSHEEVLDMLGQRFGLSGLEEKAARTKK